MIRFVLASLLVLGIVVSAAEEGYFTAAVFENKYAHDPSAQSKDDIVSPNMRMFERAAEVAANKGVDIILFSELGLFPPSANRAYMRKFLEHTPDPEKVKTNPCNEADSYQDRPILLTLSCMAQHYGIYVVANVGDIQPCESDAKSCSAVSVDGCASKQSCPEDKAFMYNTDVAFDRNGNLIARYHKNHLYFEVMNTPNPPEMVTFKTEFGVMGMIVCFDSVFKNAVELVEKHGVDTMLFPTHWFDDIVSLNAPEWQQSWALANKVNFLAANKHLPNTGSLGSGIYSKTHGALTYTYSPDEKSRLLISRVPLSDSKTFDPEVSRYAITEDEIYEEEVEDGHEFSEQCYDQVVGPAKEFSDYRCFKEQISRFALKKLTDPKGSVEICQNGLCCSATYSADKMDEDYFLAAFNGTNDVKSYFKWAEEDCFLVRCDPFNGKECAMLPSTASTVFDHIELKAKFTETARVYPTVSKDHNRLAPMSEFHVEKQGQYTVLTYKSHSIEPLLKVAIMTRVYERDPPFVPFYKY